MPGLSITGCVRIMKSLSFAFSLLLLLGACSGGTHVDLTAPVAPDWRSVATAADRDRLRQWRDAWGAGLARARMSEPRKIAAQGVLFDPDRALPGALPPPGSYRCRVFKLGANGTAMAEFTRSGDFTCRVAMEAGVLRFYKLTGGQRAFGTLYPDNAARKIFLGTLQLGDETRAIDYGRDTTRNLAGYVERVGPKRWRLVLPMPAFESLIDVIELVPGAG